MITLFAKPDNELLNEQIERLLKRMSNTPVDDEAYPRMLTTLERLHALKTEHKPKRVSPDTVLIVVGNMLVTLVIIVYEQKHVFSNKAFNNQLKPKL
jgi:hypothetical protein